MDELKKLKKDCIILAHNYQIPPIQDIADFVGDSLGLCQEAMKIDKPYILFCGVDFMAESAAILNPDKTILMPDLRAKCPMAAMLPASKVVEAKKKHPDAAVVLYINTWAEARAEADIVCTSANAIKVVKALNEKEILFGPDKNLAWHVARHCPEKKIIPIPKEGICRVHHRMFAKEHVLRAKAKYPNAEVLIHPECIPEVQLLADYICSTEQMARRVAESNSRKFIIATEVGLLYKIKKNNPDKVLIPANKGAICVNMKMHTLAKVMRELRKRRNIVRVEETIAKKARKALERMLEIV